MDLHFVNIFITFIIEVHIIPNNSSDVRLEPKSYRNTLHIYTCDCNLQLGEFRICTQDDVLFFDLMSLVYQSNGERGADPSTETVARSGSHVTQVSRQSQRMWRLKTIFI